LLDLGDDFGPPRWPGERGPLRGETTRAARQHNARDTVLEASLLVSRPKTRDDVAQAGLAACSELADRPHGAPEAPPP
jgi:hypothetical protein